MLRRYILSSAVGLAILTAGHYYLYLRLLLPFEHLMPPFSAECLFSAWILTWLGFPLARLVPFTFRKYVEVPMFLWMGIAYILTLLCLITEPFDILFYFTHQKELTYNMAKGIWIAGGALIAFSVVRVLLPETVVKAQVPLEKKVDPSVKDLKIVLLSDIHVSGMIGARRVRRLVSRVNALEPDLIFVLGDVVDGSVRQLRSAVNPFVHLRPKLGVYFVTGNHEYYSGAENWKKYFARQFGWKVLSNSGESVRVNSNLELNILGIEDRRWLASWKTVQGESGDPRMSRAVSSLPKDKIENNVTILLAHQPKDAHQLAKHPAIDLQVSGHTHGGQLWPIHWIVLGEQTYNRGLYKITNKPQHLYVTEGTAFWGPPLRLGTRCEITLLTFA